MTTEQPIALPDDLAKEFALGLAATYCPDEVPMFEELVADASNAASRRKHPLRFGIGDAIAAASPLFLLIGRYVVPLILDQLKDLAAEASKEAGSLARKRVTDWIRTKFEGSAPGQLSAAQFDPINAVIDEAAKNNVLSPEMATQLKAMLQSKLMDGREK